MTSPHSKRKMVPKFLEHFTMIFPQKLPPWLLLPGDFPSRKIYVKDKINSTGCRGNGFFCKSLCLKFWEIMFQ